MAAGSAVAATNRLLFATRRGAGAVAQTVVARFAIAALSLATGVLTARVLGASGRGEQSAMTVWPSLLAYLLTLGLPGAIRYWIRKAPERRSEFFTVSVVAAAFTSLLACAAGVLFVPFWLHGYSIDVIRAAQFLMIFAPEVMVGLIFTAMLETLGEFNVANASRYITAIATLVALVALAVTHRMTPFSAAVVYTAAPVLVAIWVGWRLRSHFTLRPFDPRPAIRVLGSYGLRSYGIDLLSTISAQVDQVLVIGLLSAADVGIYVVALNASRVITILHGAVASVVVPSASGLETQAVTEMVGRSARISNAIALIFGALLAIALPLILPLFYGHAFDRAIPVAQLLTLEAVISGLASVLSQAFMALNKPGVVTILQGLGLAAILPLMLILLPTYGLVGAAIALLVSTAFRLALIIGSYALILRVRVPGIIPTADDVRRLRTALAER
jgi:O-antigen/teichoic acid export membrane protein